MDEAGVQAGRAADDSGWTGTVRRCCPLEQRERPTPARAARSARATARGLPPRVGIAPRPARRPGQPRRRRQPGGRHERARPHCGPAAATGHHLGGGDHDDRDRRTRLVRPARGRAAARRAGSAPPGLCDLRRQRDGTRTRGGERRRPATPHDERDDRHADDHVGQRRPGVDVLGEEPVVPGLAVGRGGQAGTRRSRRDVTAARNVARDAFSSWIRCPAPETTMTSTSAERAA